MFANQLPVINVIRFAYQGEGARVIALSEIGEAIKEGRVRELFSSISSIRDSHKKQQYVDTALLEAARNGEAELVGRLIDEEASVGAKDEDGFTALHLAISYEKEHVAKTLIDKGVKLHITDNEDRSGLSHLR